MDLGSNPLLSAAYDQDPYPGEPARSYLICSTARSGSSLLSVALDDMDGAAVPAEYFNPPIRDRLATRWGSGPGLDAYVDAVHRHRTDANGVFGVKAHWHQLLALHHEAIGADAATSPYGIDAGFLAPILPDCRYIWILRRDVAAQAVSFYVALVTNAWADSVRSNEEQPPAPPYDFAFIERCRRQIEWEDACWTRFFLANHIRPFAVVYEEFEHAYDETLRNVLEWTGTDARAVDVPDPPLRKQRTNVTREYADAYMRERAERGCDDTALLAVDTVNAPLVS